MRTRPAMRFQEFLDIQCVEQVAVENQGRPIDESLGVLDRSAGTEGLSFARIVEFQPESFSVPQDFLERIRLMEGAKHHVADPVLAKRLELILKQWAVRDRQE